MPSAQPEPIKQPKTKSANSGREGASGSSQKRQPAAREAMAKEVSALARDAVQKQMKRALRNEAASTANLDPAKDLERLASSNGQALQAVMTANEVYVSHAAEITREMLDFGSRRLHHDFETLDSLMKSGDASEIVEIHGRFAETAYQHYADQTVKVFGLMTQACQDCWAPFTAQANQAWEELYGEED